jgi:hypothetical protein
MRGFQIFGASVTAMALVSFAAAPVAAQTAAKAPAKAPAKYTAPRTPDGKPDLAGVWDYRTATPLERPNAAGDKAVLSEEEIAAADETASSRNQDRRDGRGTDADVGRAYNDFWWDFGKRTTTNRSSLIVDPPDGRVPALTAEAQARGVRGGGGFGAPPAAGAANAGRGAQPAAAPQAAAAAQAAPQQAANGGRGVDSWLDRSTWERCLTFGAVPRLSGAYNNNFQLIQSGDTVVILYEMIHEARVIPINGRPHGNVRQWLGDSVGHWEGDTLVVDTTNFTDKLNFRGSNTNLHLTERFTRVGPDTLLYEFTANDPTTWTKPWTVQMPVARNPELLYEYACHEGNYGMFGILAGGRAQEKAAADAAKKGSN